MKKIPCMLFRGGTSKGPYFHKSDLPEDDQSRNELLLRVMGSPDLRQIDGIGGGDSLSSKVAIVSRSERSDADLDYLFCQVFVDQPKVGTQLNCGNMASAVLPFAIEAGLIETGDPETTANIYNVNTNVLMQATVQTPNGQITYDCDQHIDGVPKSSAPIKLGFLNAAGAKTGSLLPTGSVVDDIDGTPVTCLDMAVPMVIVDAKQLGKYGDETKAELDEDREFMQALESLRLKAAVKMGMGDVSQSVSPKICIVNHPIDGSTIQSHYFTPFDCHAAHAVSGALCLATACVIPGTVAHALADLEHPDDNDYEQDILIEHPSGHMKVVLKVDKQGEQITFPLASIVRTARPLFSGEVWLPESLN